MQMFLRRLLRIRDILLLQLSKMKKRVIALGICLAFLMTGCKSAEMIEEPVTEMMSKTVSSETVTEVVSKVEESQAQEETQQETQKGENEQEKSNEEFATPSMSGALQVIGNQLCDANGNPVQLRGLSTHGIGWFPGYVNSDLFGQFRKEWKANVVRLAMYTAEGAGYCTGGNQTYLKELIHTGVKSATENDMYVIIDWHILSDNNPNTYKDQAIDFFSEMSQTYKDYNNVLYEICNEPNGGTDWAAIKSYALEVIPAIRANDPDAIIIVGTPTWSQDVDQAAKNPITEYSNIMYTLHFYAGTHQDSLRNKMGKAIEDGLPIFVTEYGICDASGNGAINYDSANKWVEVMNSYGVSYCAWSISNKNETCSIFKSSVSKTKNMSVDDLSESGNWVYQVLSAGNGTMSNNDAPYKASENTQQQESQSSAPQAISGGNMSVQATVTGSWESDGKVFYQYAVRIENTGTASVDHWSVELCFNEAPTLTDSWNGNYSINGNNIQITGKDYNCSIEPQGSVSDIGFIVCGSANLSLQ